MISIVIPCYNESENLRPLLDEVRRHVQPTGERYEILIVDDGSVDDSLSVLRSLRSNPDTKFLSLSRNFGHQIALKAGLDHASGDVVITMDGDLQHPPRLIPTLLAKHKEGFLVVNTIRRRSGLGGFFKRLTSSAFYSVYSQLSGMPVPPGSADFRLIDKRVVEVLREFKEPHIFFRGLIHWVGFPSTSVEYDADARAAGEPKFTVKKMIRLGIDGIMAFSIRPLRVASVFGIVISLFSLIYILYGIGIALFTDRAIPGWASLLVSVLFLGGLQMVFLGLLGEYIGKIFIESKNRPQYVIKERSA